MNVGESVRHAIDEWERANLEAAMLHACNAVDGTSRKVFPKLRNHHRFTQLLREHYAILGPMGVPGINLADTRFPVRVRHPTAPGGQADIADVIYGIHRCSHNHGDELPDGFELIPNAAGPLGYTRMELQRGKFRMSDRIIFGLLAVAVLNPMNSGQSVPAGYRLTYGKQVMPINEWWGRAADFPSVVVLEPPLPNVKLDFGDWMRSP